jgi:penicillin-binding protein 1A
MNEHRDKSDWIFRRGGKNRLFSIMDVDAWIDSSLHTTWQNFKNRWNAASDWFAARFRLTSKARLSVNVLSEGLTLGVGGMIVMLVLAIPAFREVDEGGWLNKGQFSVTFLDRYGNEIGKRGIRHDDAVPLEDIPDHLIKATLATEDRRFFDHFGVDVIGTFRAFTENLRQGETVQGGSSITQQLAKNLFLSSERSLQRKIKEAYLALWLESRLTKQEILKLYLDRAYMGGGAFGVEAAAQFYFGKSVRDVTLAESAMMAGLYKAPTKYAPHANLPNARARADDVLTNLVDAGFMTESQVHGARTNPAKPVDTRVADSPDFFLDWAFEEVQRTMQGRQDFILTARTTVDPTLQRAADDAVNSTLRTHGRVSKVKNAAMVAMDNDGAVRAMVGGQDYGESQFNRATQAKRQPGSSFKSYVFLTALETGRYTPKTTVSDSSQSCGPKGWTPKNYTGGYGGGGSMPMSTALAKSLNTVAVDLSLKVGREKVIANTQKLGINGVIRSCSMALGDTGISVMEHTQGYAHFANAGKRVKGFAFTEIRNSKGDIVYSRERDEAPAEQLFQPRHIEMLNSMLHEVVVAGTGKRAILEFASVGGKTGTSTNYRDAWFIGFTGKYTAGVWFGNDDYKPMHNVTGGSLPTETWTAFMKVAHRNDDIPALLGIPTLPAQIERSKEIAAQRQQDLATEQAANATAAAVASAATAKAAATSAASSTQAARTSSMPAEARESIKKLATAFRLSASAPQSESQPSERRAAPPAGIAPPAPDTAAPAGKPAAPARDRRADDTGAAAKGQSAAAQRAANTSADSPLRR